MLHSMRLTPSLVFALASVAALGAPRDDEAHELRDSLQAKLDALREEAGCPGFVAGITLDDGTTFSLASGVADEDSGERLGADHRMLAGSTGKLLFAAVALDLVEVGRLDLDAKAASYLEAAPWFARLPNHADITVRQLMNHTSGLVRYELHPRFLETLAKDPLREFTIEERLECLFDAPAPFPAGERFEYSDTNYVVLGAIVERVLEQDAYAAIAERVTEPLHLDGIVPARGVNLDRLAQGHPAADDPFTGGAKLLQNGKLVLNPQFEWAGGGFATTAADLARLVRHQFGNGGIESSLRAQVVDGVEAPQLGPGTRYGLCCIVKNGPLGTTLGHSGFFPGYVSDARWFVDSKIAVAVQVNTSDFARLGKGTGWMVHELARTAIEGARPSAK